MIRRLTIHKPFYLLLLVLLWQVSPLNAAVNTSDLQLLDASQASVMLDQARHNRRTGQTSYRATLTNHSSETVNGVYLFVITDIIEQSGPDAAVTLLNANTYTNNNKPVYTFFAENLAPGATLESSVIFHNARRVRFDYTSEIYFAGLDNAAFVIDLSSLTELNQSNQISMTITPDGRDPQADQVYDTLTVSNISGAALYGPFYLDIRGISLPNIHSTHHDAVSTAKSAVYIDTNSILAAGEQLEFTIGFYRQLRDNFTYTSRVYHPTVADDDNDGVNNQDDQCPDTPAGETVDANGCSSTQIDSDGDGVNDAFDPFPNDPNRSQLPAVQNLSATLQAADEQIEITWQNPADIEAIASYQIYRTSGTSGLPELINSIAIDGALALYTIIDSAIQNAQVYNYQVIAITASGLEGAETTPANVIALWNNANVEPLTATRTPVAAQLQWTAASGQRYRIYRRIDSAAFETLTEVSNAQYLDNDAVWDSQYQYQVSALLDLTHPVNGDPITLESPLSNSVSIAALPALQVNLFDVQNNGAEFIKVVATQNDIALSGQYLNAIGPVTINATSNGQTVSENANNDNFRLLVPFTQNNAVWVLNITETTTPNRSVALNVRISIDNIGPLVTLDNGAQITVAADEINIRGTATDNSGQIDSIILTSSRLPSVPFSAITLANNRFSSTLPLVFGENIITARAIDVIGNTGSAQVLVNREIGVAPSIEILSPLSGSVVNQTALTINGRLYTSLAPENIRVVLSDQTLFPQAGNTPNVYTFQFNVTLQQGRNSFVIRAETTAGNSSANIAVTYQKDSPEQTTPPMIQITQPTINTFTKQNSVIIAGSVSAATGPAGLSINGENIDLLGQTMTHGNFQYVDDITTQSGAMAYELIATDGAGLSTTKTITITRDVETPVITINNSDLSESPTVNTVVELPYHLLGNVNDANLASLSINEQPVNLIPTPNPDVFDFNIALQLPLNQDSPIQILARDYAGNQSEQIYILNAIPQTTIEIISPLENAQLMLDAGNANVEVVARLSNPDPSFTVSSQIDQSTALDMLQDQTLFTANHTVDLNNDTHTLSVHVKDQTDQVIAGTRRVFNTQDLSNIPLSLLKTEPANNESGVEPDVSLNFYFNKPIDPALLNIVVTETANGLTYDTSRPEPEIFPALDNTRATTVYRNQEPLPSEIGFLPGNTVVMIIPSRDIAYGANVYVTVNYDGQELSRHTFNIREVPSFIQGMVVDQIGQAIVGIDVSLPDLNLTSTTDNEGSFAFGFGLDADNALPPGRHKVVYNTGMKSKRYGEVTQWVDVQRGLLKQIPPVTLPLINTEIPYQAISSGQSEAGLVSGELRFDFSHTKLRFPNGRRQGDVHVQFATAMQLSYSYLTSAAPQWVFQIHPAGIQVDGNTDVRIKMPPLLGSSTYIPPNDTYVLIVGLDPNARLLLPIGVGRVEDQQVYATLTELKLLDYIGYVLAHYDEDGQALLKQHYDHDITLAALIQALEGN